MYKRKLFLFGLATALLLTAAMVGVAVSTLLTQQNLKQLAIAQSLLSEHQQISSISYRMFKQLTDELIFGKNANQAEVRKKQAIIEQSFTNIRRLELEQRSALGEAITQGSVEDTDELHQVLRDIITEFYDIVRSNNPLPLEQQVRLERLLEVTIDNQFREAINAAVERQGRVVAALTVRIETLNTAIVWFAIVLGVVSFPLIIYGCFWLFNQLYRPLVLIRNATDRLAEGNYQPPLLEKMDDEFDALAHALNQLANRLHEHETYQAQSRQRLEVEVQQRTSELTQANLELTRIDTKRRQFIADLSHELRTPLTIIRGEAQVTLRLQSAAMSDYRTTLNAILEQAVNLSRLVEDLLLLTRAEMNQLALTIEPVALLPMIEAEVFKWQRAHATQSLQIDVSALADDTYVMADKPRIQQVLSILIDNAVKYSSSDSAITIKAEPADNMVRVSVTDQGPGIPAPQRESIFERFVRFNKQQEGLGLGLPIAKVMVESHGGNITLETSSSEGSTFSFTLPLGALL